MNTLRGQLSGQMSLEFIVKLLLLLVVAAVVIGMFIGMFPGDAEEIGGVDGLQEETEIVSECQQVCDRWRRATGTDAASHAVEYCTQRFVYDADGTGQVQGETGGTGYNTYCQDGVRCFNLHECDHDFTTLDADTCNDIMCDYFQDPDIVDDPSAANAGERVHSFFELGVAEHNSGAGTCGLDDVEGPGGHDINTWWDDNFDSTDVCG